MYAIAYFNYTENSHFLASLIEIEVMLNLLRHFIATENIELYILNR